jgi:hypothetical protein
VVTGAFAPVLLPFDDEPHAASGSAAAIASRALSLIFTIGIISELNIPGDVRHHRPGNATTMRIRRILPWLIVFEMLKAGRAHWDALDPADRADVTNLFRRTHGNPRNLTEADKAELRDLARRLHLARLGISLGSAAVIGRRRHRRGR